MNTIVIGASGATGRSLVSQLLSSEEVGAVAVWVRRKSFEDHPKLVQEIVSFERLADYADKINATVAFSCMGTTLKTAGSKDAQWRIDHDYQLEFARLCLQRKVRTFVLVSAMGANANSKLFYNRMKGCLEDEIKKLPFERLIIFQPSLLIRHPSNRPGEKFFVGMMTAANKLGILGNYRPIKTDTLAKAMLGATLAESKGTETFIGKQIFDLVKR